MTRDQILDLCSSLPGAVEDYPFGDDVAVFKIGGKMFALVPLGGEPASVNLKCDPEWALELRARYPAVRPGYHQNKRHWNTVELDGTVDDVDLREMIDHSYELVVGNLPRNQRTRLLAAGTGGEDRQESSPPRRTSRSGGLRRRGRPGDPDGGNARPFRQSPWAPLGRHAGHRGE